MSFDRNLVLLLVPSLASPSDDADHVDALCRRELARMDDFDFVLSDVMMMDSLE